MRPVVTRSATDLVPCMQMQPKETTPDENDSTLVNLYQFFWGSIIFLIIHTPSKLPFSLDVDGYFCPYL